MMLEFEKNKRQTYVLMELLADVVGYDSLWRSLLFQDPKQLHSQMPLRSMNQRRKCTRCAQGGWVWN
jgi:hypothetical protein